VEETIDQLRCRLIKLATEKDSLVDPEVIALSHRLDSLIVFEQRVRLKSLTNPQRNIFSVWQSSITRLKNFVFRYMDLV
jgi:hypothetical protein